MSRFVLDCSVSAAAWCLDDEASPLAEGLLQDCSAEGALGPPLWVFEMANVLVVSERKGRIIEKGAPVNVERQTAAPPVLEITSTSITSVLPAKAPRHPATPGHRRKTIPTGWPRAASHSQPA